MKCVAYCRVSKDTTDQLNSLENQIKHYTELFEKEGYEGAECGMYYAKDGKKEIINHIPSIFADEGISGTKLKNREAFKYMLECAYRKEFEVIYVKNVQRWARSVEDGSGILKKLKVMGIKVVFEDGNLNNFEHEMVINMFFSVAQEESRAKSIAVQFGIRKAQNEGKFTATAPFGYDKENGFLVPNKEKLETANNIFNWYINGFGVTKIVKELNKFNTPTQKGGKWAKTQIYNILTNPIYTGKQITHTVINTDINVDEVIHKDGDKEYKYKQQKPVEEDKQIINYRKDLRVISDELFEETQIELQKRKEIYGKNSRSSNKNIFSNLLYCENCGKALRRKKLWGWKRKDGSRKFGVEWCCINHDTFHNDVCEFRNSWHEEILIERVKTEIEKIRKDKNILNEAFKNYIQMFLSTEDVTERLNVMQNDLNDINLEVSANLKLFSKDIIKESQYKQQNNELQIKKKEIEFEINKLKKIDEARNNAKKKYNNYVDYLNKIDLDDLDNNILKKIISRIEAYTIIKNGKQIKDIKITWNILDKSFDDIFYRLKKIQYTNS